MMRAVDEVMAGSVTMALPLLGTPLSSVVGYVKPPSVERRMFTVAQLTGAAVVPATFQVTVWAAPPVQVTAVLGAVTTKGPAVLLTFRLRKALKSTPPITPAGPLCWSRAVQRNFSVRVTVGRRSPMLVVLASRLLRRGK